MSLLSSSLRLYEIFEPRYLNVHKKVAYPSEMFILTLSGSALYFASSLAILLFSDSQTRAHSTWSAFSVESGCNSHGSLVPLVRQQDELLPSSFLTNGGADEIHSSRRADRRLM
jgi:hypothetical protein